LEKSLKLNSCLQILYYGFEHDKLYFQANKEDEFSLFETLMCPCSSPGFRVPVKIWHQLRWFMKQVTLLLGYFLSVLLGLWYVWIRHL